MIVPQTREKDHGFRMIQAQYTDCTHYFYYYYISSISAHQALDPRGGDLVTTEIYSLRVLEAASLRSRCLGQGLVPFESCAAESIPCSFPSGGVTATFGTPEGSVIPLAVCVSRFHPFYKDSSYVEFEACPILYAFILTNDICCDPISK